MKKCINRNQADQQACWDLRRTVGQENMVSYELRTQAGGDGRAAEVTLEVIRGLLDGMQVGMIAESGEAGMTALSGLASIWHDGRLLKRGQGGAFVAMERSAETLGRETMASCADAGAAFRFLGFDQSAPADRIFRGLMDPDSGAAIEVSCPDLAGGVLCIRLDAEKIDETKALGGISEAVGDCGRSLRVEM